MAEFKRAPSKQRSSNFGSAPVEILDDYSQSSSKTNSNEDAFFKFNNLVQKRHEAILKEIDSAAHILKGQNTTKLTFEAWAKVFSFLSPSDVLRCSRVCKFFERIGYDDGLWRTMWAKSDFIPRTDTLEQNEICWRVKYRFFSGKVVKSGMVHFDSGNGIVMRSWRPAWCILHGSGVAFIDTTEKTQNQIDEIRSRSEIGLRQVTVKYPAMASFAFDQASISFDGALFGNGKFQIVLRTSKGECRFALQTDADRAEWVAAFETLTKEFGNEAKRFRHFAYQNAVAQGAGVHVQ